jgi:hypothetical protein
MCRCLPSINKKKHSQSYILGKSNLTQGKEENVVALILIISINNPLLYGTIELRLVEDSVYGTVKHKNVRNPRI